ncbi:MAG TPA: peptide-methionine (S)-S-oxide reductase [Flavobacteriales bacterium]|nr:peptide-methionine (S)-S-oxide reductase [Flavobacteriales bacterium]
MTQQQTETAIFAGGCFWCTEAIFKEMKGVKSVVPGYTGGKRANPTYEQVSTGATGHAEAVKIEYDPTQVSYEELLQVFFATHDPTTLNRQGNDVGTQYRSAIFYTNERQKDLAEAYIKFLNDSDVYDQYIVTEVVPAEAFYEAEDYHKNYLANNPDNPYCQYVVLPKLEKFKKYFKDKLKHD